MQARETPTTREMVSDIRTLSTLIDELVGELREQAVAAAREDASYREAYSRALLAAKSTDKRVTNGEAEAMADVETISLRVAAKVAEAMADATKQALLARRTQLSALQSVAAAVREEMAFTRTGPF